MADRVRVTVCFARPSDTWQRTFDVEAGTTLADAIAQSGVYALYPEAQSNTIDVGVFGKRRGAGEVVRDGDRIELYRPLIFDPMDSRRRRAAKRKAP